MHLIAFFGRFLLIPQSEIARSIAIIIDLQEQVLVVLKALPLRVVAQSKCACIDLHLVLGRHLRSPRGMSLLSHKFLLVTTVRALLHRTSGALLLNILFLGSDLLNLIDNIISQLLLIKYCSFVIAVILNDVFLACPIQIVEVSLVVLPRISIPDGSCNIFHLNYQTSDCLYFDASGQVGSQNL